MHTRTWGSVPRTEKWSRAMKEEDEDEDEELEEEDMQEVEEQDGGW